MGYTVAVVGATGAVGAQMIKMLEESTLPIDKIRYLASARSAGKVLQFKGQDVTIEETTEDAFEGVDIALFSAGGSTSAKYAPYAVKAGAVVVDNTSYFRQNPDVPLVVPEVNAHALDAHNGIIACPNCSTIQMMVALEPVRQKWGLDRIIVSTYQAVSGSGVGGIKDLENGINGGENKKYPHQIAYNCLPHIDEFLDNGYTKEEMKMINETKKILNDDSIRVTATTVRVPVKYGHCVSINLEFENPFEMDQIYKLLQKTEGVNIVDDVKNNVYPMPIDVEGKDEVYVGRIRRDYSVENGINMWVVADNIRKGAATNTVQIAELLIKKLK